MSCSRGTEPKDLNVVLAELSPLIEKQMEDWRIPGLAIGIVKDGEVVYARGFGFRDREAQLPVTTKTLFPIGSCTKAMTALAAAMAVDEGVLDLDAPIRDYVPEFETTNEQTTARLTMRDLLVHQSGLADYRYLDLLTGASREEALRRLGSLEPEAEVGEKFSYSNLGYTLAGFVVGRVFDRSWEDIVSERIFQPLGMTNTCFTVDELAGSGDFAVPYMNLVVEEGERWEPYVNTSYAPCGGGVADIDSMLAWLRFNMAGGSIDGRQLVSREMFDEMIKRHIKLKPWSDLVEDWGYGFGWYVQSYRGHAQVYHGGLYDGYTSMVSFMPEAQIGVVVLTNSYYHHFEQVVMYEVYDRLLGLPEVDHNARELETCRKGGAAWRDQYNTFWDGAEQSLSPSFDLDACVGAYSDQVYGQVTVDLSDGGLYLTFESGKRMSLKHFKGDTFATASDVFYLSHIPVTFQGSDDGGIGGFTMELEPGMHELRFTRQKPGRA